MTNKLNAMWNKYSTNWEFVAFSTMLQVSDRIVQGLEEHGISQTELAQRAGLHDSQISRILKGHHNVTVETLAKIAVALELDLDSLFQRPLKPERG